MGHLYLRHNYSIHLFQQRWFLIHSDFELFSLNFRLCVIDLEGAQVSFNQRFIEKHSRLLLNLYFLTFILHYAIRRISSLRCHWWFRVQIYWDYYLHLLRCSPILLLRCLQDNLQLGYWYLPMVLLCYSRFPSCHALPSFSQSQILRWRCLDFCSLLGKLCYVPLTRRLQKERRRNRKLYFSLCCFLDSVENHAIRVLDLLFQGVKRNH